MRIALLLGAISLDALLLVGNLDAPDTLVIHPVAPPLTRIAALGDAQLGVAGPPARGLVRLGVQRAVQQVGTPGQRAAAVFPPPSRASVERSRALRLAIEADAVALADQLGPARVSAFLAHKEDLSEWYGEGRTWQQASGGGATAAPTPPAAPD